LLEAQRKSQDNYTDDTDHRVGKAEPVKPQKAKTDDASATHSRLLTKKQLSDMVHGARELSRRLGNVRLKLQVRRIFLLTKAHDEELIAYTREVTRWLLSDERETKYTVYGTRIPRADDIHLQFGCHSYVQQTLENNSRFDARGLIEEDESRSRRLKYWTADICAKHPQTFDFVISVSGSRLRFALLPY
jgi:NAD+ kinase